MGGGVIKFGLTLATNFLRSVCYFLLPSRVAFGGKRKALDFHIFTTIF